LNKVGNFFFYSIIAIFISFAYFTIVDNFYNDLNVYLKYLIYIFCIVVILGPLLPKSQRQKQKNKGIIFKVIVISVITVLYFIIINILVPDTNYIIVLLLYILIFAFVLGALMPHKRGNKPRYPEVAKKIKEQLIEIPDMPLKKVNLNIEYEPSLITKCVCGMLLTSHTKKCPQCGRPNPNYISQRKIKI